MHIRFIQATEEDQAYLLSLRQHTMVEHLEREGLFYSAEQHLLRLQQDYLCAHIVWIDNKKVGLLKFSCQEGQLDIKQIQLEPSCQGKGLGRKILQHLLATTVHKIAVLTVLKHNPAQKLYLDMGFEIVGDDQYEFHMQKMSTDIGENIE
ncbi:GNAT family N-acetyltransferase [Paraglaciecola sp.]|uniref:GNAT family N-acetyltransferase n=1 Tax=Paraglaciecola sp. TaxID=1920173 RepID=UPI0030F46CD8